MKKLINPIIYHDRKRSMVWIEMIDGTMEPFICVTDWHSSKSGYKHIIDEPDVSTVVNKSREKLVTEIIRNKKS